MSLGSVSRVHKAQVNLNDVETPSTKTTHSNKRLVITRTTRLPPCHNLDVAIPFPKRSLFCWNVSMFLFHTTFAVMTLVMGNIELRVPLYRTELTFLRKNMSDPNMDINAPNFELVPKYIENGYLPLTVLVSLFFFLSAFAHFGNAIIWRRFYEYELERCRVTTRRIEYFFSAPLMILLIGYNAGIREYLLLFALAGLIASTMPFGYITELLAEPASETLWTRTVGYRVVSHLLGYIPQMTAWLIILINFYEEDTGDTDQSPPAFVYVIIWLQLILFFSFGVVQIIQIMLPPKTFYKGEIAYQWLSLISKGLLGSLLLANVLILGSFEEIYEN